MKPHFAVIAVIVVALVGIIASGATQWYLRYPYFDKAMHFAGGFVIAWLAATFLAHDPERSTTRTLSLIIGVTLVIGIGWEIAEYLSNRLFADATEGIRADIWRYFHGGDPWDTFWDIIADLIGGFTLAAIYLPMVGNNQKAPE